jgi:hypothetical protein
MPLRRSLFALALLFAAGPALACSETELQAKSMSLGDLVKKIAAKDPQTASDWRTKQIAVEQVAQTTTDLDTICAAYDKAIAEAQASQ